MSQVHSRRPARVPARRAVQLFVVALVAFAAWPTLASAETRLSCERVPELFRTYLQKHIDFHYLNDELRTRAIDNYVKRIDPSKVLFLQDEVTALESSMVGIFQDIREGDCSRLLGIEKDVRVRVKAMEDMVRTILSDENYALDENATLILDPEKRGHPANAEAQKELMLQLIHFQISNYLSSDMDLAEAKEKLIHRYELKTKRANEITDEDVYAAFLDSFASALDPHSNYFSRDHFEDFQISMGLSLEGIGVALSSRDGYSVVEKVIPGGAAAMVGVLEPQDKIIAVKQDDSDDTVDIIDMDLRDVVRLIRGKRGTTVHLTVLRQGETTERFQVSIVRDKIRLEEAAAKLRVEEVETEEGKLKLGVLDLPSFYGDRNPGERQSSRDVEKLLREAKEKELDGLVLDLSRNGGGLLENSVDIAGFFIERGGVVAVRDGFAKVQVLRDRNSKIIWDGPLVVLTSRVSASASEIVAGALKDYDRAVVVGDGHTFGKGTVQSMVQLHQGLGALKVTTALFFRPGGRSTQNDGVASDVVVPSPFNIDEYGERYQPYALPGQAIPPFVEEKAVPKQGQQVSTPWKPVTDDIVAELNRRSAERVASDEKFTELEEKLAKARAQNGVMRLGDMMAEQAEEQKDKGDDSVEAQAGDDDLELTPQQQEALRILVDLVELQA
jgi:carboxyl-terminal processing protease